MIVSASDTVNLRHVIDAYKIGYEYDGDDVEEKTCPICGELTYEFYYNIVEKDIVGCTHCVNPITVYNYEN